MQIVKEGQVICYIEQLGGQLPIEVCVLKTSPTIPNFHHHTYTQFTIVTITMPIIVFFFLQISFQSDVSGEVIKILREDGG
jgi:hypothetical protein